jgi:small subunit ribosomal protein S17
MTENTQNLKFKRKLYGVVTSETNEQTIVVNVVRRFKHRTYNKFVSKSKKYHAHDVDNKAKVGDRVTIVESKPYSKKKKWELLSIN